MLDGRAYLRIREGAFTYLLAPEPGASIEHRDGGALELAGAAAPPLAAWHLSGDARVPVARLGGLMGTRAGDWEYAVLLSGAAGRFGLAAEHVQVVADAGKPAIQPFNPAGCSLPGGPVITGLCPGTDPEYLVLDASGLERCLRRALDG